MKPIIPVMRTALQQIQELHCENVRSPILGLCRRCLEAWPCKTRKLADEGLTDRMARETSKP